jgi:hypothetical protein
MRNLGLLLGVAALSAGCAHFRGGRDQAVPSIPITTTVTITVKGAKISVDPPVALLQKGGQLTFAIASGSTAKSVTIDFSQSPGSGPFPPSGPKKGQYTVTPGNPVTTANANAYDDCWRYVVLALDSSNKQLKLDPMVVVKG